MNIKTSDMTKIAMFSVLTALGAYIQIPIPYVPITLQVLFCMLSGIILGSRKADILSNYLCINGACWFTGFCWWNRWDTNYI